VLTGTILSTTAQLSHFLGWMENHVEQRLVNANAMVRDGIAHAISVGAMRFDSWTATSAAAQLKKRNA
jgi:hypothetical protein